MDKKNLSTKYLIIGAGLSGLTTANALLDAGEDDFIILEGRNYIGGRISTVNGIDLGATWFQNHHTNLLGLIDSLKLKKFEQYSKGEGILVYNTMAPAHYFENQNEATAYRIEGGSTTLITELSKKISEKIRLKTNVLELIESSENIQVNTDSDIFLAKKVICTIPPKLASVLSFTPPLPTSLLTAMGQTHTWMSNAMKIGMTFKSPFWREKKLSGTVIGQVGPVIELYDHTSHDDQVFALMGFINESLRDVSSEQRKERILEYLAKYLGQEIRDHISYFEKDWSKDEFTSCNNLKSVYMSPHYGNPLFNEFYFNGKLLFSGTETSPQYGGYLDGAVFSGVNTTKKLLNQY